MTETTLGPCEGCQQTRPLTRYIPRHQVHGYEPDSYSCRWCMRDVQLLLCAECTVLETAEESGQPRTAGERMARQIFAAGSAA
jgi:hypothetical protein